MIRHLLVFLLLTASALAATLASDGSRADVQAKVNSASDGDTVTIPAGTFADWTTAVTITGKAIHLQGAGADRVLARSHSSIAVGTGTKVFTLITESVEAIESLKSEITNGATLRVCRPGGEIDITTHPTNWVGITGNKPWMEGTVTSLSGTTLTMNITSTNHSGTYGVWVVTRKPRTTVVMDTADGVAGLSVSEATTGSVEISGINFEQGGAAVTGGRMVNISATTNGEPVLIHDCSGYRTTAGGAVFWWYTNQGVMWNCSLNFLVASYGGALGVAQAILSGTSTWPTASTMGTADTTGKSNLYIESCDFHFCSDMIDVSDNGRLTVRKSLFNNAGVGIHGSDTGTWGARHYELYDNAFVYSSVGNESLALGGYLIPRGGTGVFTANSATNITGPWGDAGEIVFQVQQLTRSGTNGYWGSNNDTAISANSQANPTMVSSTAHGMVTGDYVRITGSNSTPTIDGYRQITRLTNDTYTVAVNVTVAGTAGKSNRVDYPAPRQVGYGYTTGTGVDGAGRNEDAVGFVGDSEPFYAWNNTGTVAVGMYDTPVEATTDADSPSDYVKASRDYFDDGTAKPGWTAYTYPHPLRSETPATPRYARPGASATLLRRR